MERSTEDVILEQLASIQRTQEEIRQTQLKHVRDIENLKVKTGLWSALVSAVVAIATGMSWR